MKVLLETGNAVVGLDELKKAIVVIWSSDPVDKEFDDVYNCVLKAFKIYFVNRLINDFSNFLNLTPYQINFLTYKIIPLAHKCGLRHLINVSSNSGVVEGFTEQIESMYISTNKKIIAQTSETIDQAFEKITF